jgi:hypothetical protein
MRSMPSARGAKGAEKGQICDFCAFSRLFLANYGAFLDRFGDLGQRVVGRSIAVPARR